MNTKQRLSPREVWLLALLPGALVLIVSLGLPGPSKEIGAAEQRLNQLTVGDAQSRMHGKLREYSTDLSESEEGLAELEVREAEVRAELDALETPTPVEDEDLEMAQALDELTVRLAEHGVRVIGMKRVGAVGVSTTPSFTRRRRGRTSVTTPTSSTGQAYWQVSVAATWPAVRAALSDEEAFPDGLGLAALEMEPARTNTVLRRWGLTVSEARAQ